MRALQAAYRRLSTVRCAFSTSVDPQKLSLSQLPDVGSLAGVPTVYHPDYSAPQLPPGHRFPMVRTNSCSTLLLCGQSLIAQSHAGCVRAHPLDPTSGRCHCA